MQAGSHVLMDIGCGSGISGSLLSQHGHTWIGCDVSPDMLHLAQGAFSVVNPQQPAEQSQTVSRSGRKALECKPGRHSKPERPHSKGLVFQADMAQGFPIRSNSIDGAISISAVQWLCHLPQPEAALQTMFSNLHRCLKPNCKAVLQVYLTGDP